MAQYIPKEPLVAKIERLKADALQKKGQCKRSGLERIMHQIGAYNKILSFLDTLEVKEIDWEKEVNDYFLTINLQDGEQITENTFRNIAKHFSELGLKAQKG